MPFIVCDCACSYRRDRVCELEIATGAELPDYCPLGMRREGRLDPDFI